MKWVTREKAKVDRIACPWLVKKFVDPKAEFLFVPREKVLEVAKEQGAIPYDSPGAELFHYKESGDERCSFDAIIKTYKLTDPALLDMAEIVRTADDFGHVQQRWVRELVRLDDRIEDVQAHGPSVAGHGRNRAHGGCRPPGARF